MQRRAPRHDYKLFFVQRRAPRHDYKRILCSGEHLATTINAFLCSGKLFDSNLMMQAIREMVGAAPVCPPERPRSDVSMRKEHVPMRKGDVSIRKEHIPSRKGRVFMRRNVCRLRMMHIRYRWDAPLQGDTGGHIGTAPTSLYQTPLPRNLPQFSSSGNTSPAILGHGTT